MAIGGRVMVALCALALTACPESAPPEPQPASHVEPPPLAPIATTPPGATAALERVGAQFPGTDATSWMDRGLAFTIAAQEGMGREALLRAEEAFTRAIELEPSQWTAWSNRGVARARMGKAHAAIDDFTRAMDLAPPNNPDLYTYRGGAYAMAGDDRKAMLDYTVAIALGAGPKTRFNRANAFLRMKKYRDAATDYTILIDTAEDPQIVEDARTNLARIELPNG